MPIKLLRLREVANRLDLSLWTVRRWASERRLPVVKIGRSVFVDERELDRFCEARALPVRSGLAL